MRATIICLAALGLLVTGLFLLMKGDDTQTFWTIRIGTAEISVEVADTAPEITGGLSGRKKLSDNAGMLFMFQTADRYSFWMKDMHFPLDIIWIDEERRIVEITPNVSPDTYPQTFQSTTPVTYVLEMNAGWAARNAVAPGMRVELE